MLSESLSIACCVLTDSLGNAVDKSLGDELTIDETEDEIFYNEEGF